MSTLEQAHPVADTVLFEGYLLYPYRADDAKNQVRWQFGVLAPPSFVELDTSERSGLRSEIIIEGSDVELTVQVRFLQVQRRLVERATDAGFVRVDSLEVKDATFLPCDEAIVVERDAHLLLKGLEEFSGRIEIVAPGSSEIEELAHGGSVVGRLIRSREPLHGWLLVEASALPSPFGVRRLRLQLQNCTEWHSTHAGQPDRPDALRHALVAAHLLVRAQHGAFISQIDPPEWAREYVRDNEQCGTFPVLAGSPGERDLLLAAPIILYDYPQVAPESVAQFCDATEMDEMLTLRTLTLTDAEKRLVRGSDPKAAALVDHVEHLPPDLLERLHGAIRGMAEVARPAGQPNPSFPEPDLEAPWWDPGQDISVDPDRDVVVVDGTAVARGVSVRLRPGRHGSDAQDMFLEGRTATVEAVLFDVDGNTHLAVTLDDLAEDGHNPHGRFLYFSPAEIEPIRASA